MTPEECERSVCAIARELKLWLAFSNIVTPRPVEVKFAPTALRFSDGTIPERVEMATEKLGLSDFGAERRTPAELGSVTLDGSRVVEGELTMAHLGAKSDWFDMNILRSFEKPDAIKLFNKIARRVRKHLPFFARNRWKGESNWHKTKIRHSVGIVHWVRNGGRIGQWGHLALNTRLTQ
jgi:hypothetical protein